MARAARAWTRLASRRRVRRCRRRARRAGSPLDARWMVTSRGRRARPRAITPARTRTRSISRPRIATCYAFIEKARAQLPQEPARVFVAADAHYFRGRAAYHLYPHNVYFEPFDNAVPPRPVARRRLAGRLPAARRPVRRGEANAALGRRRTVAAELKLLDALAPRCSWSDESTRCAFFAGWALVWALGIAVRRRNARTACATDAPGEFAWTIGCGFFAGAFMLTRVDARAVAFAASPLASLAIGLPLCIATAVLRCGAGDGGAPQARVRRLPLRVAEPENAPRRHSREPARTAWYLLAAWLVAAVRDAAARRRAGHRSIRGTRGSSGRPRRASGIELGHIVPFGAPTRGSPRTARCGSTRRRTIRRPCRCGRCGRASRSAAGTTR